MNKNVIRTAIIVSWVILIACFVIKVLGGNWFEILIDEGVGSIVDNNIVLSTVICSLSSYILFNFYYLAICERRNFKLWVHLLLIPYFAGITVLKIFVDARYHILIDLLSNFVVPFLLVLKTNRKFFRIIIAFVLNCGFQAVSVMIRNASFTMISQGSLIIELILSIDVTIMLILYYLYSLYGNIKKQGGSEK